MTDPPLTLSHKLSIKRTQHQRLPSPSVPLNWTLEVHGRSSLTHMVVTTIQSWYVCLLLLETQTREVISAAGCSQKLIGSDLQSCLGRIMSDILQDQDPLNFFVGHAIDAAKDSIPMASTIPKSLTPWFDEEYRDMLKARRALARIVHRRGAPRAETLMSFRSTQAQALRLFNQKKIMDNICLNYQHQHPNQTRVG